MNDLPFAVGDTLEAVTPHALASKIRVTAINEKTLTADVLEGVNTEDPLTVFRVGWALYRKVQPEPVSDFTPNDLAAVGDFATLNAMERSAPNILKELRTLVAANQTDEQIMTLFLEMDMSAPMIANCVRALKAIRRQQPAPQRFRNGVPKV